MSEGETPRTMLPPESTFLTVEAGLVAWRPEYARIHVAPLPNGGRHLTVNDFGGPVYELDLDREQAAHLAKLLSPPAAASDDSA